MLQITPTLLAYAGIVILAVPASACAPIQDQKAALILAVMFFASWVICEGSWTPYGINRVLQRTGYEADPFQAHLIVASVLNMLCGLMAIRFAWERFAAWKVMLFGLCFAGCTNDVATWLGAWNWLSYNSLADPIFLTEEAIFFALGAPHAIDLLRNYDGGGVSRLLRKTNFLAS